MNNIISATIQWPSGGLDRLPQIYCTCKHRSPIWQGKPDQIQPANDNKHKLATSVHILSSIPPQAQQWTYLPTAMHGISYIWSSW